MKVYVIAAMHGEELFGLKVAGLLLAHPDPDIRVRIGNPLAIAKRQRFIDSDMNRSFLLKGTYEARLAKGVKEEIAAFQPDYIIDLHTSVTDVRAVAIVAGISPTTKLLAAATGTEAIVRMPRHIAKDSFIGCYADRAVSIELGKGLRSDVLAGQLADAIRVLTVTRHDDTAKKLPIFEVEGVIDKDYKKLDGIKNLIFNPDLNGYPFLAGKNTYATMGGFLAQKIAD